MCVVEVVFGQVKVVSLIFLICVIKAMAIMPGLHKVTRFPTDFINNLHLQPKAATAQFVLRSLHMRWLREAICVWCPPQFVLVKGNNL